MWLLMSIGYINMFLTPNYFIDCLQYVLAQEEGNMNVDCSPHATLEAILYNSFSRMDILDLLAAFN